MGGLNKYFMYKEHVFGKCDGLEVQIAGRDMNKK